MDREGQLQESVSCRAVFLLFSFTFWRCAVAERREEQAFLFARSTSRPSLPADKRQTVATNRSDSVQNKGLFPVCF
jgi:hypothetical protein